MRVLWVLKVFGLGGAERLLLELLPHLRDVEVIPVAVAAEPLDLVLQLRAAGLAPVVLGSSSDLDPSWLPRLRSLVRRRAPDIVHFHAPLPAAGGRLALLGLRVPIVYTEHGSWSLYRPATRLANRLTFGLNAKVFAVSEAVRRSMPPRWARRVEVLPNGIDMERVAHDAANEPDTPIAPCAFGTVGHLTHPKGADVLVRAAALVQRELPEARCIVVGEGPLLADTRALADRVGATVELLGLRTDARAIVSRLDVFVLPSRTEGLPLTLLEAMALGRPIVVTRVGGIPEVVEHDRTALLVEPNDPQALAAAILRLLRDRELASRLGAAAAEAAERRWDARGTASRLLEVYREVAAG